MKRGALFESKGASLVTSDALFAAGDASLAAGDELFTAGDASLAAGDELFTASDASLAAGDASLVTGDASLMASDALFGAGDATLVRRGALGGARVPSPGTGARVFGKIFSAFSRDGAGVLGLVIRAVPDSFIAWTARRPGDAEGRRVNLNCFAG